MSVISLYMVLACLGACALIFTDAHMGGTSASCTGTANTEYL